MKLEILKEDLCLPAEEFYIKLLSVCQSKLLDLFHVHPAIESKYCDHNNSLRELVEYIENKGLNSDD